jgi:hypothetical protein
MGLCLGHPTVTEAATLKLLQRGDAVIPANQLVASVAVVGVDPGASILLFSAAPDSANPSEFQIGGRLADGSTIVFERFAAGREVPIRWTLVEFGQGVTVQRGSQLVDGTVRVNGAVVVSLATVDPSHSFPLISIRGDGTGMGSNNFIRARLSGPATLELASTASPDPGTYVDWQVVTIEGTPVQHGSAAIGAGQTAATAQALPFEPWQTWLIYSYAYDGSSPAPPSRAAVRGGLDGSSQISFDRDDGSAGSVDVAWSLVQFTDGTSIQHGIETFAATELERTANVAPIDPARSFVVGGHLLRGGRSGRADDDNFGAAWMTLDLASRSQVRMTRAVAGSTAQLSWSLITLGGSAGSTPGGGGEPPGPPESVTGTGGIEMPIPRNRDDGEAVRTGCGSPGTTVATFLLGVAYLVTRGRRTR